MYETLGGRIESLGDGIAALGGGDEPNLPADIERIVRTDSNWLALFFLHPSISYQIRP